TLIGMGVATAGIGLLPTYAAIGVGAPIMLILLRVLQGFSAGGEWGRAALMAVEHAPQTRRSFFGSYPQIGVPLGMILATIFIITSYLTEYQLLVWGWRLAFLSSSVVILIASLLRPAAADSPVLTEMQKRRTDSYAPLGQLFCSHRRPVILAELIFAAIKAAG